MPTQKIDPITVATTWHYIQRVCREMRENAERTATNVLVVTLHDMAYGIWDSEGRVIAIPEGFPPRLISSSVPIRRVKEKFAGDIHPGDVFLTNFPQDGAVHLPDWVFVRPIFYKGELVFFTCMGTHVADSGGALPGTHFLAHDSIGEGLNIPLIRIMRDDHYRQDVLELILTNNRLPEMMKREMASLTGSTLVAEQRMIELLDKYGKETVLASVEEMINRTEKAVRAEIAKWPEGAYSSEIKTDDDGLTMGAPVAVRCTLTIKKGELTFDFSKTDDQVKGMINSYYQQTLSNTLCSSFLFLGTELAAYHNEGSLRPIHILTRKGSIVDARPGALVAGAPAVTGSLVIEAVLSVLSQALPERAIAPYSRLVSPLVVGREKDTGELYVYTSFGAAAGAGAVSGFDGYQCACDMGTLGVVGKTDAEEEMVRFPWEIERYEFRTDAHGAGKWRGSPGIVWEGINKGEDCFSNGGPWSGFSTQAPGVQGGWGSPTNQAFIISGGSKREITQPHIPVDLKHGDRLLTFSGGGAGVGKPEERDPALVSSDVKNDLVSRKMAEKVYKVALKPGSWQEDLPCTMKLRRKKAKKR